MTAPRQVSRTVLGAVTLVIVVGLTVGVMAGAIGPQMFSGGGRLLTAVFANAQQLIPGDEVRVQGVTVGTVSSVKLNPGGHSSTVVMSVDSSAGSLYRNATATLAWKTVLGAAFNVDLTRGTPGSGLLGSSAIPISHTANQVELDDLLTFDNGGARTGLQRMFAPLATALSNPQPPAQVLGTLARVSPAVSTGVGAVRGLIPDSDLRTLISASAQTVQALDAPDDSLRAVVQGASATLGVTAAREADLKAALDGATPAMDQTKTTFSQLRTTFDLANPLLTKLNQSGAQVAPTIAKLYPTVVGARNLLDDAVPLLRSLPASMRSLASASQKGLPLLQALEPSLGRLENTVLPYLNTVDPGSQRTTAEMIGPTTEALGPDIAGQMDQNGHFIRFPATGGSSPLYLPCQTYFGNPSAKQDVACESLSQMLTSVLNYNPLSAARGEDGGEAVIDVRDYRTERINRARLSLELKRALRSGLWVGLSLIAGGYIALRIANDLGSNIGVSSQSVSFLVSNANDVVPQADEVRFLGIPAGRVSSVQMTSRGPVITASFNTQYGHIYRNAQAVIRPNTALEDMYLDITYPGTRSAGRAGTTQPLAASQTDTSVNIDDVLDVFRMNTRASLRSLLDNLGNGLADHGASLREGFVDAVPFIAVAGRLSQQLAERASLVRQLVHNAALLTSDLGQNQASLRQLVSSGGATLTTLEDSSQNLNATLAELPPTLTDLKSSLGSVSGVVGDVDTAVKSLYPVADDLPMALGAVRDLSASASPAVQALQAPVQKLTPLAQDLVPLASNLSSTVSRLLPQVPALNKLITDLAGCRTGVQGFFEWNPSLAKYGDIRGQSPRGNVAIGLQSSGVLTNPFEQAEPACTPGTPIGGSVVTAASEH